MFKAHFGGVVCALLSSAGCSAAGDAEHVDAEAVGVAHAEILLAPPDAKCIDIKAVGTSTVTQQFTVTTTGSTVFALSNLPLGNDTFSAQAFNVNCPPPAGTMATYVSDPVVANVSAEAPVGVQFQMRLAGATGQATVGVNFTPAARGSVTEYALPTPCMGLQYTTVGPDGNLWFTDDGMPKIRRSTTSGTMTEFVPSSLVHGICPGPDGNMWFAEPAGNKVGRITLSGTITEFAVPTASASPEAIAAGPDGNLWFSEPGASKLGRITTSGTITEFALAGAPWGVCAGPDGNVWATESTGNKLARITPSGTITEFPIPTASAQPRACTTGADGNIWFVESGSNKIARSTPTGSITEFAVSVSPHFITPGPDGALWASSPPGSRIVRVTTAGVAADYPTPGSLPVGITAGPDGGLWFGEAGPNPKKLARMAP